MKAAAKRGSTQTSLPRWNDRQVWQFGLLFAGSIVAFFVINAYAGFLFRARGESEALENFLLAYNTMPLLGSFTILAAPGWIGRRKPIAIAAVLTAVGLAGFTFLDGWASWAAALFTGFVATVETILLISLPTMIATGAAVTRLTAGMTLIGFAIAFVLPLFGGWLAGTIDRVEMTLIPSLMFTIVVLLALGRTRRYPKYE